MKGMPWLIAAFLVFRIAIDIDPYPGLRWMFAQAFLMVLGAELYAQTKGR